MIKQKDLKCENKLYYYEDKLFTGQSINNNGSKYWYKEGKKHRENDLPATEYSNGDKFWLKEGKLHREIGPAIECSGGYKYWYKEGKHHRENGPAIECSGGDKEYWISRNSYYCNSDEEFFLLVKRINLKIFE